MIMNSVGDSRNHVRWGLLITTIGGLLFTLDLPLLRLSLADKWTMVAARGFFLFLSITAIWFFLRHARGSRTPYIAGAAGITVAITNTIANICFIGAVAETNAANVVFISALVPVITAAFSRIFIGERVHGFTWMATAISIFGVVLIVGDGISAGRWFGDMLALISAICTSVAFTVIRASRKNVATSLAVGSITSGLIALIFFGASTSALLAPASFGLPAWGWLAINGLLALPVASALLANGPRYLPSADVSMFLLLETVLTPVWIWLMFGEMPSDMVLIGGLIVVVTLVAHSLWRLHVSVSQPASPVTSR